MPHFISQDDEDAGHVEQMNKHSNLHMSVNACGITAQAAYHLMGKHIAHATHHFISTSLKNDTSIFQGNIVLDQMANGVVHPITQETITKYEKLARNV